MLVLERVRAELEHFSDWELAELLVIVGRELERRDLAAAAMLAHAKESFALALRRKYRDRAFDQD